MQNWRNENECKRRKNTIFMTTDLVKSLHTLNRNNINDLVIEIEGKKRDITVLRSDDKKWAEFSIFKLHNSIDVKNILKKV